jgi:hypothetical protein
MKLKYPELMTISFWYGFPLSTSFVVVVRLLIVDVSYLIRGYSCTHVMYILPVSPCDDVFLEFNVCFFICGLPSYMFHCLYLCVGPVFIADKIGTTFRPFLSRKKRLV